MKPNPTDIGHNQVQPIPLSAIISHYSALAQGQKYPGREVTLPKVTVETNAENRHYPENYADPNYKNHKEPSNDAKANTFILQTLSKTQGITVVEALKTVNGFNYTKAKRQRWAWGRHNTSSTEFLITLATI